MPIRVLIPAALSCVVLLSLAPEVGALELGSTRLLDRPLGALPFDSVGHSVLTDGRSVSADGRYVVFTSTADALLPGGTDIYSHCFRHDRTTNTTLLLDVATDGSPAQGDCGPVSISSSGGQVAFGSYAPSIVAGDAGLSYDLLHRDLAAATPTIRVSLDANDAPIADYLADVQISGDGNAVVFTTSAKATPGDTNDLEDVYERVIAPTPETYLVSARDGAALGDAREASIDADGSAVAFYTFSDGTGGDGGTDRDIYVTRDVRGTPSLTLVSRDGTAATDGVGGGEGPSINDAGDRIVFSTEGNPTLHNGAGAAADGNSDSDVYLWSAGSPDTWRLVSRAAPGANGAGVAGDRRSRLPVIAQGAQADRVVFESEATDLDAADDDPTSSAYVADTTSGTVMLASRATGVSGASAAGEVSGEKALTASGEAIFDTRAENLSGADSSGDLDDVFARAPDATTTLISRTTPASALNPQAELNYAGQPMSADGRYVVLTTALPLVPADVNELRDVYRIDANSGEAVLVSATASGNGGDGESFDATISADGRRVAFASTANDLGDSPDARWSDVFVRDLDSGLTRVLSVTEQGSPTSFPVVQPVISGDGGSVAFAAGVDLVSEEADYDFDIYRATVASGALVRVSVGDAGQEANDHSLTPAISADGSVVAFRSTATNLVATDGDASNDIYVRDLTAATTRLLSAPASAAKQAIDADTPSLSDDGRTVAFATRAALLGAGGLSTGHVYVRGSDGGGLTLASRAAGAAGAEGDRHSGAARLTRDGTKVLFQSSALNLGYGRPEITDTFMRDLEADTLVPVGRADGPDGEAPMAPTTVPAADATGDCAIFSGRPKLAAADYQSIDFTHVYMRALTAACLPAPADPNDPNDPADPTQPDPTEPTQPNQPAPAPPASVVPLQAADAIAPAISGAKLSRRSFGLKARRPKVKKGTTLSLTLSEAATLRLQVERLEPGRRSGRKCVKQTARNRKRPRCERSVVVGAITRAAPAGAFRLAFDGKVGSKRLRPGKHRFVITARDAAGNASRQVLLPFTIVR